MREHDPTPTDLERAGYYIVPCADGDGPVYQLHKPNGLVAFSASKEALWSVARNDFRSARLMREMGR